MPVSVLGDWGNFYVIAGSAAAGLTGLTFVVIALAADARRVNTRGLRTFVTPTIVHFGTVLALSAFLSVPHQSLFVLGLGLGIAGAAGVVYSLATAATLRRISGFYTPVFADWLWHAVLPTAAYAGLVLVAFVVARSTEAALEGTAVFSMGLLYVGIHNAWDVAVSISVRGDETATR